MFKKKKKGFKALIVLLTLPWDRVFSSATYTVLFTLARLACELSSPHKSNCLLFFHQFLPSLSVTDVRGAVCYCVCYDCHFVVSPPVRLQTTCHRGIDHSRRGMCVHVCTCVCVCVYPDDALARNYQLWTPISTAMSTKSKWTQHKENSLTDDVDVHSWIEYTPKFGFGVQSDSCHCPSFHATEKVELLTRTCPLPQHCRAMWVFSAGSWRRDSSVCSGPSSRHKNFVFCALWDVEFVFQQVKRKKNLAPKKALPADSENERTQRACFIFGNLPAGYVVKSTSKAVKKFCCIS